MTVTNVVPRAQRPDATWLARGVGAHGDFGKNSHGTPEPLPVAPGTTVSQLMKERGMDYHIGQHPTAVIYTDPTTKERFPMWDGQVRLIREPQPGSGAKPIIIGGSVKQSYQVVQNMEIATMLDPLVNEWPVATADEFDNGTKVFVALRAGDTEIGGDEMHDFFVVSDVRDGGHAVMICYTTVRKVCKNGLMVVTKQTRIKLPHNSSVKREADFYIRFMARIRGIQDAGRQELAKLAAKTITTEQAHHIIDAAHPLSEPPTKVAALQMLQETHATAPSKELTKAQVMERMAQLKELEEHAQAHGGKTLDELMAQWNLLRARVQAHRERVYELYEDEVRDHAGRGTALLAVESAVEYADWRITGDDDEGLESMAESSLFGKRQGEKTRALQAAEAIVRAR